MKIVIAAPHSLCPDTEVRSCDLRAGKIASLLNDKLNLLGVEHSLHLSDKFRKEIDFNRLPGREFSWRNNLSEDLEDADYLIEIHSFPNGSFSEKSKIVFLNISEYLKKVAGIAENFSSKIVSVLEGSTLNDIQYEIYEKKMKVFPILIEFNEDESILTESEVNYFLDKFINTLNNGGQQKHFYLFFIIMFCKKLAIYLLITLIFAIIIWKIWIYFFH